MAKTPTRKGPEADAGGERRGVLRPLSATQPSAYCTERVLSWRLREAQRELHSTQEELQRTRAHVAQLQRFQDPRWQQQADQAAHRAQRLENLQEDLKADLQKMAVLGLTQREAELKHCAAELWSKWALTGPMPRRSTKDTRREKEPGRIRARKRWQHVAQFVRYAFGPGAAHSVPAQRYLAFRVKELCEVFLEQVNGSVYEAVMLCARKAEIERSVKDKLQKKRKGEKCLAFEDLETEMLCTYGDAFEDAGGVEEVNAQLPEVGELLRAYRGGRVRQDAGYEILGLKPLYELNNRWLDKFEAEVQRLASCTRGQAMVAPLKSYDRARAKVITRYGGDSSCITDVMRASIVYPTIAEVYSALKFILKEDRQQPRADLKVMEVNDRFQFGDGYRDLTLLFEMSGVIVEVQMQIKGIQDVKKSGGHKAYRVQREVNELIFEASVQNSEEDVVELVKAYSVSGQGTKDKNGRSALHYSLHHGALRASRALLAAGSDPWLEDDHGVLGFELSLKNKAWAALELVLSAMLRKGPRTRSRLARLAQNVPWWCANVVRLQSGDDLLRWREAGRLLVMVLRHYEALQLLEPYLLELAQTGDSKALRALIGAGADQVLSPGAESLLDYAIKSGQVEMVKMLVCMQLGDGTPFCAHCFKESPHVHLKIAAKLQDVAYAKAALVAGADPRSMDSRNVGKRTALMSFAFAGELGLCEELVEAKAEVQWIDGSCCNAIHYALALKQDEVAQYLRDLRVVTEVPLKHGSPKDVVQYLLKAAQEGCCGAIYRGQESLRSLQFSKIDTGQWKEALRERFGPSKWTLLHYAVKVLRSADPAGQVCRALLAAKADPRLADADGETPLHWAAAGGHAKAYEQLVQAAYRLEAEHRGPATEPLEPLLQETQKALRRQLLRDTQGTAAKEVADDDAKWLQAGLLAFKHAVLFRRLVGESQEPRVAAPKRVMKKKTTTVSRGLRRRPSGDFNSPGSSQKTLRCQKTLSESSGARIALVPDGGSSSSRRPSSSPMSRPASASSEKKTRIGFTDKPDK